MDERQPEGLHAGGGRQEIDWTAPLPATEVKGSLLQVGGSVVTILGVLASWWLVAALGVVLVIVGRVYFGSPPEESDEEELGKLFTQAEAKDVDDAKDS